VTWSVWETYDRRHKWWRLIFRGSEERCRAAYDRLKKGALANAIQLRNADGNPVQTTDPRKRRIV
jgi:hypothetical protein